MTPDAHGAISRDAIYPAVDAEHVPQIDGLPGKLPVTRPVKKGQRIETVVEGPLISNHQHIVVPGALQGLGIMYACNDDGIVEALKRG